MEIALNSEQIYLMDKKIIEILVFLIVVGSLIMD